MGGSSHRHRGTSGRTTKQACQRNVDSVPQWESLMVHWRGIFQRWRQSCKHDVFILSILHWPCCLSTSTMMYSDTLLKKLVYLSTCWRTALNIILAFQDEWRKFVSPTCPGPRSAHAVIATPAGGGKIFLFGTFFLIQLYYQGIIIVLD